MSQSPDQSHSVNGRPFIGPPNSGPPTSGPPISGPPTSGLPISGPPISGPPISGPPNYGPPIPGPLNSGPSIYGHSTTTHPQHGSHETFAVNPNFNNDAPQRAPPGFNLPNNPQQGYQGGYPPQSTPSAPQGWQQNLGAPGQNKFCQTYPPTYYSPAYNSPAYYLTGQDYTSQSWNQFNQSGFPPSVNYSPQNMPFYQQAQGTNQQRSPYPHQSVQSAPREPVQYQEKPSSIPHCHTVDNMSPNMSQNQKTAVPYPQQIQNQASISNQLENQQQISSNIPQAQQNSQMLAPNQHPMQQSFHGSDPNQQLNRYNTHPQGPNQPKMQQYPQPTFPNQQDWQPSTPDQLPNFQPPTQQNPQQPALNKPKSQENPQPEAQEKHKIAKNDSMTSPSYSPQIGQLLEEPPTSNQPQTPHQPLIEENPSTSGTTTPYHSLDETSNSATSPTYQAKTDDNSLTSPSYRPTVGQEEPYHSNQTNVRDCNAQSRSCFPQMGQMQNTESQTSKSEPTTTFEDQTESLVHSDTTVLVRNLNPDTSSEDLSNYLENVLNNGVIRLQYSSDQTMVIVTVEEKLQDENLIEKKLKALKGNIPVLCFVQQATAVAVRCHAICDWRKHIKHYFESTESGNRNKCIISKGMEVDDAVILMFEDIDVVRQIVSKKDHNICGQEIQVEEFYQEAGCPTWSEDKRPKQIDRPLDKLQIRLLNALNFPQVCMLKYKGLTIFLGDETVSMDGPRPYVQQVEQMLESHLDKMKENQRDAGLSQLKAQFLDHPETEAYVKNQLISRGVQSSWICRQEGDRYDVIVTALSKNSVDDTFGVFGKTLVEADIEADNLSDEEFLQLEKALQKQKQNCFFLLHNQGTSVLVVTTKANIEALKTKIQEHLKKSERKISVEKKDFEHRFTPRLKSGSGKFIYKHMKSEFEDKWNVKITQGRHNKVTIHVENQEQEHKIQKALDDLQEQLFVRNFHMKGEYISMLYKRALLPDVAKYVEKTTVCSVALQLGDEKETNREWREGVWHVNGRIKVHAVFGDTPYNFDAVMVTVDDNLKPVGPFSKEVHQKGGRVVKKELERFLSEAKRQNDIEVISTPSGSYSDATTIFHCVKNDYQDFLEKRKIIEMCVSAVLDKAHLKELVSIAIPPFTIGSGVSQTFIAQAVVQIIHSFVEKGETTLKDIFLLCNDVSTLNAFETNMKQFFEPSNIQLDRGAGIDQVSKVGTEEAKTDRQISVHVVTGSIADQEVDVIVNTVGSSLKLSQGAISKALLERGGEELQQECKTRYPQGVTSGDFARTTGTGILQCKEVFHCCLPSTTSPDKMKILKSLMDKMLNAAAESEYSSIALPSLGTGNLGYHVEDVAPKLFDCIRLHQRKYSTIKDIRFVIYHRDVVILKEFQKLQRQFERIGERHEETPAKDQSYASVVAKGTPASMTPQKLEMADDPPTLKVQVVDGAMTDQKVDVIVNSTNPKLDLSRGAVSSSILNQGGQGIQAELLRHYPLGIKEGHFAVSHGGNLGCKQIYHCYVPMWDYFKDTGVTNMALLQSLLLRCLESASDDNFKSIAFPAFGTGKLNYPREIVAGVMFNTVMSYRKHSRQGCSLRKVFFVVYGQDRETMSAFLNERDKYTSSKPLAATPERALQRSTASQSWNMKPITVTLKQGDLQQEQTYCAVISVAHSMDLSKGTISRRLVSYDSNKGDRLQRNFKEKSNEFLEKGMTLVTSNETCAASVLILVDREWIHKDQQQVLLECLNIASMKKHKSLALPILASGGKPETAATLAKDLHAVLWTFCHSNPKGLEVVNVVVFEESQFAAFREGFERAFIRPRRTAPPIPTDVQDSVVSNRRERIHTATVEYTLTSNRQEELEKAEAMLMRLSTKSDQFHEEIIDERISCMDQANVLKLSAIGKEKGVRIKNSTKEKKISIWGKSLESCEALKEVEKLLSELQSTNKSNIQQSLKSKPTSSSKKPAKSEEISFMSIAKGEELTMSNNSKDIERKNLKVKRPFNDEPRNSPGYQATAVSYEEVDEGNLHGMGKVEKIQTDPNAKNNGQNSKNDHPEDKILKTGSVLPTHTSSLVEGDDDEAGLKDLCDEFTNINLNVPRHMSPNTATVGSNSNKTGSNTAQMGSNSVPMVSNFTTINSFSFQMDSISAKKDSNPDKNYSNLPQHRSKFPRHDSNEDQKDSNSPDMDSNSSQTNTDEHPTTTSNSAESTDTAVKEEDTGTDSKKEWFFVNDTESGRELQSYEPMTEKIESMYLNGDQSVLLPGEDEEYVIDFPTMEEFVKGSEEDRVSVVRREILPESDVDLPAELKDLSSNSKLLLVDRTSEEFERISSQFLQASKDIKVTVVKIEKMLNISVYQSYQRKKKWIKESAALTEGDHVERSLWHGPLVNTDSIVNLSSFGFNRSYCTSGGDKTCGEGVYFYPFITDILDRSKKDASGHHHVCLAKVLTGRLEANTATLSAGRRRLIKGSHSLVDSMSIPSKFVIFYDNQALPEYLVTFSAGKDGE